MRTTAEVLADLLGLHKRRRVRHINVCLLILQNELDNLNRCIEYLERQLKLEKQDAAKPTSDH